MGNTNPAAAEDAPEKLTPEAGSEAEPGANGSAVTKNEDGTPSASGSGTGEDGEDEGETPEATPEDEPKDEVDDDEEPPVRPKSPASFAKTRIANKAAKDGAKQAEKKGGSADDEEDEEADDDLEDDRGGTGKLDVKSEVQKGIAEAMKPFREQQEKQETEQSVTTFLADPKNKLFTPFKAKILRFATHESRRNIPVSSIAWEVAGPKLLAMGAKMEQAAAKKANTSRPAGGTPGGQGSGKTGVMAMTTEQFKEHQRNVLNKRPAGQ